MKSTYKIQDKKISLIYLNGINKNKIITNENYSVSFTGREEFILYIKKDIDKRILSSEMEEDISIINNELIICYKKEGIEAIVRYYILNEMLHKTIIVKSESKVMLKRIITENMETVVKLKRGGEGQPVFLDDIMWCGMEFPVALNEYKENKFQFMQCPFVRLNETAFKSYIITYAFKEGDSLDNSFLNYIKTIACKNEKPLKIYCDWGKHDELSDQLDLTDKMCDDITDEIVEFNEKYGVHFDYYLMDAFWFEEYSNYIKFKNKTFPNGIHKLLEKLKEIKTRYGLWFDVNFIHGKYNNDGNYELEPKETNAMCFSCEKISKTLENALLYHIKNNNVKMLKFDFAFFECENQKHSEIHSTVIKESKEVSVKAFVNMVNRLKKAVPELIILAYNGWTTSLEYIGSVKKRDEKAISPWWTKYINYLYCGDPRPSEIETTELADSLIYYTDSMIRQFTDALMPLQNIDDHGAMIGNTGTIYWLGKQGYKKSMMMNIMRGNNKMHLYGDMNLFDNTDKEFVKFISNTYDSIIRNNMYTNIILGNPIDREIYGYSTTNKSEGYVVIVNPKNCLHNVLINIEEWKTKLSIEAKIIFRNNMITEKLGIINQNYSIKISANEIIVIYWRLSDESILENNFDKFTIESNSNFKLDISSNTKNIALKFVNKEGAAMRTLYGIPEGITALVDGEIPKYVINKPIWSGSSWQVILLENNAKQLDIINKNNKAFEIYLEENFQ